jgi:serine/threonine protein kinase
VECRLYSLLDVIGDAAICGRLVCHPKHISLNDLIHEIQCKEVQFQEPKFSFVSPEAKDLIKCLLEKNPNKRITCDEALRHRWFCNVFDV